MKASTSRMVGPLLSFVHGRLRSRPSTIAQSPIRSTSASERRSPTPGSGWAATARSAAGAGPEAGLGEARQGKARQGRAGEPARYIRAGWVFLAPGDVLRWHRANVARPVRRQRFHCPVECRPVPELAPSDPNRLRPDCPNARPERELMDAETGSGVRGRYQPRPLRQVAEPGLLPLAARRGLHRFRPPK